jgi:UDP-N-acetylmuramate--alanine ligase
MSQFLSAFEDADNIVITEIYAARESKPEDGFSGNQIAQELRKKWSDGSKAIFFEPELISTGDFLIRHLKPGDVLLVLSAGDADRISTQVLNGLQAE